jgi:hypothetical protein
MTGLYGPWVDLVVKRREAVGSKNSFLDLVLDRQEKLAMTRHELPSCDSRGTPSRCHRPPLGGVSQLGHPLL